MKKLLLLLLVIRLISDCYPQDLFIPREIKKAYDAGTRSMSGNPGLAYFQNRVNYSIDAEFNPQTRLLKGIENITYQNNSGFSLRYAVIRLYQNIFKAGGVRGREVDPADVNDGVKITSLKIKGKKINLETDQWILRESQTNIFIPFNCRVDSSAEIEIGWEFTMPANPNDRFGGYNENTFYMGYWFPQVSVFDDINGWDTFDYNAVAEFYNEFGDFDVRINVPENYIVWGTGILQNPQEVLMKKYLQRFLKAQEPGEIIHVISAKDRKDGNDITPKGMNTWRFTANNVSDFAFGTSSSYLWDATGIVNKSGKKILVQSAYSPDATNFSKVTEIIRWSLDTLEKNIVGVDYPYPAMTAFNGTGGMEYPMIINDRDGDLSETLFVTTHEVAHSYFPFLVGTNQRRNGWLDEGLVTMLGMELQFTRDSSVNLRKNYVDYYPLIGGTQMDIPQIVNSIDISDHIFQVHEYVRPSLAFWTLRDIMGNEMFHKCIVEFISRWEGKHPTPWDFFYTCNNVTGEDYSWFFEPWFNRFAYSDLSVKSASYSNGSLKIDIENCGGIPIPSKLVITYKDGSSDIRPVDGKQWSHGKTFSLAISTKKQPLKIQLDTSGYPECNDSNNLFEF